MQHRNIPIFIPHMGCPHRCVFCNQRSISGCHVFREELVRERIETVLSTIPEEVDTQIAFFGGSFTGIDRALMCRLLETAEEYVTIRRVSSIRLSTRPDYISDEILRILSRYSVKTIELGLQSMDDRVLIATERGHTAKDAARACRMVVDAGFSLVGQMMIGLPGATPESEIETARQICALGASAARIYPTVVFADTPLADMMMRGEYQPLSLEEAVTRSAEVLSILEAHHVLPIRIGLCENEALQSIDHAPAGPRHAALGEMVWNEYYYCEMRSALDRLGLLGKDVVLTVPPKTVSKVVGQSRCNLLRLERESGTRVYKIIEDQNAGGVEPSAWQAPPKQQEENNRVFEITGNAGL